MKRKICRYPLLLALIIVSVITGGCTLKPGLRTGPARESEITGNFTLLLHGCRYLDDPETIAFLDKEADGITYELFTPAFNYKIKKGLSAADALAEAGKFVSCHTSFQHSQLRSIQDDKGAVTGYEVRPLYLPLTYGVDDILMTDYRVREDRLIIKIRLIPSVEMMLSDGGSDRNR